jgi:ligand-binding SRPBCC domain-containing protein
MKQFQFRSEIWLPRPLTEVFPFFADAGNLDALTPGWLRFEILTPRPIAMRVGARIDYRLRLRGLPIRWQSEISDWNPPHRFVDEQRCGPYRLWHHTHTFTAVGNGTTVRDLVCYSLVGGALTNALFVKRDLQKIFAYRQEKLAMLFPATAKSNSKERP